MFLLLLLIVIAMIFPDRVAYWIGRLGVIVGKTWAAFQQGMQEGKK